MKSYTDLNQSIILSKILSNESVDMCWQYQKDRWVGEPDYKDFPQFEYAIDKRDIPCWSLSALLEVIRNNGRYELQMYEGGYYFEANGFMTESYFYPIDACYEMILKLHEEKLI